MTTPDEEAARPREERWARLEEVKIEAETPQTRPRVKLANILNQLPRNIHKEVASVLGETGTMSCAADQQ